MPLLVPIILFILLPSAEVYLLFSWIADAPAVGILYLLLTMAAGLLLMRLAKFGFREILRRAQSSPQTLPPAGILALGKLWFVGFLLFFPGYMTDVMALLIWFLVRDRQDPPSRDTSGREATGRFIDEE